MFVILPKIVLHLRAAGRLPINLAPVLRPPYSRLAAFIAAAVLYAAILVGSLSTEIGPPALFPYSDKFIHMSAWAALTAVSVLALRSNRISLAIATFLLLSSGAVELTQAFVPGRSASYGDLLANAVGIVAGGLLARAVYWRFGRP